MTLQGLSTKRVKDTVFVALPVGTGELIQGGCRCPYCKDHPGLEPRWDTLAIDANGKGRTTTVHYPDFLRS